MASPLALDMEAAWTEAAPSCRATTFSDRGTLRSSAMATVVKRAKIATENFILTGLSFFYFEI